MIHLALYILCIFSIYRILDTISQRYIYCYRATFGKYSYRHRIPIFKFELQTLYDVHRILTVQLKRLSSIVFVGSQISPVFRPQKCTLKYIL